MLQKQKRLKRLFIILAAAAICGIAAFAAIRIIGRQSLTGGMIAGDSAYAVVDYQGETYQYKEHLINILCMGIDKEEEMDTRNDEDGSVGQADAIFLVSLDLEAKEVRVITVPRDTMVVLEVYTEDGKYLNSHLEQLTLQYGYADGEELSAELMCKRVSELLYYLPINAYAAINFEALWEINDAIGGVDITMDDDYTLMDSSFTKGSKVHLEGEKLISYIHGRNIMEGGSAYTRIHRLKQYMLAFVEKAKAVIKEDSTIPVTLMEQLAPNMRTSLTVNEVVYLVTEALECSFLPENMYTLEGKIEKVGYYEEYYLDGDAAAQLVIDLFYE